MLYRVHKIYILAFRFIRLADKHKIIILLDGAGENLLAVFHPVVTERVHIVPGCGDTNHQFVSVGFHGFFDDVVLFRGSVCVKLIGNSYVAVQRIVSLRIRGKGLNIYRAVRQFPGYAMLLVVVEDSVVVGFAHFPEVVVDEIEGLQGLFQRVTDDVYLRA